MNKIINYKDYDDFVCRIAWKLCGGDPFLMEELRSEMYIAILNSKNGKNKGLCLREAKCRAIDYLRSRLRNYSYAGVFKHYSLEAMEESGFQIDTEGNLYYPNNQIKGHLNNATENEIE